MINKFLCFLGFHKYKTHCFGYWKWDKYPKTLKCCSICNKRVLICHNLFGIPRPDKYCIEKEYITYVDTEKN